jgi:phage host-nuclease inhibitor protein Gam
MTRAKKTLVGQVDRTAAEEAFAQYAKADAKESQLRGKMDVEMTKIREKYQDEIADLQETKDEAFETLLSYAENNREDFGGKKSMELTHGVLGFRTGTPKLKTRKGFTWQSVTNLLKTFAPEYIRVTEEPAKDRLLADREVPELVQKFQQVGIFVDQDETFFVEPKKELSDV